MTSISSVSFYLIVGTILAVAKTIAGLTFEIDQSSGGLILASADICIRPGKFCKDCNKVIYCIELSGGHFIRHDLYDCTNGQTCLDSIDDCSLEPNPQCQGSTPTYKFICHQVGTFPDAEDCTKYNICVPEAHGSNFANPTPYSVKCRTGYSYDSYENRCRNKLVANKCQQYAPSCTVAGQSGIVPGNPSLYYICMRSSGNELYFPQMFMCVENHEYIKGACLNLDALPSGVNELGKCTKKGVFHYPSNYKKYYVCDALNTTAKAVDCFRTAKFSYETSKCEPMNC